MPPASPVQRPGHKLPTLIHDKVEIQSIVAIHVEYQQHQQHNYDQKYPSSTLEKDFQDLGKHCHEASCNQQDFLPFRCNLCHLHFCLDHRSLTAHHCSSLVSESTNNVKQNNNDNHHHQGSSSSYHTCHKSKCKKKEAIPMKCKYCGKTYCLTHRNPLDHNCSK